MGIVLFWRYGSLTALTAHAYSPRVIIIYLLYYVIAIADFSVLRTIYFNNRLLF